MLDAYQHCGTAEVPAISVELEENLVGAVAHVCKSTEQLEKSLDGLATKPSASHTKRHQIPDRLGASYVDKPKGKARQYPSFAEWLAHCKCSKCGVLGHKMKDCPTKGTGKGDGNGWTHGGQIP